MRQYYLLNNTIEFWPDVHQLVMRDEGRYTQTLNTPASRCLELLLERRPQVVMQQDFYRYVWGEGGPQVSVNTLYQNMALLRKGLRTLDNSLNSAVITIPKQGFQLNETLLIEEMVETEPPAVTTVEPIAPLQKTVATPEITASDSKSINKTDVKKQNINRWLTIYISALLVAIVFIGNKIGFSPLSAPYFEKYRLQLTMQGCSYYSNAELSKDDIAAYYLDIEKTQSCKSLPYRYITSYQFSSASTMLACDKLLLGGASPRCVTYTNLTR